MSLIFCKKCGTLYDDSLQCPKCTERELMREGVVEMTTDTQMDPETLKKERRKSWVQLCIGVPAMIGLFYLVFSLFKKLLY